MKKIFVFGIISLVLCSFLIGCTVDTVGEAYTAAANEKLHLDSFQSGETKTYLLNGEPIDVRYAGYYKRWTINQVYVRVGDDLVANQLTIRAGETKSKNGLDITFLGGGGSQATLGIQGSDGSRVTPHTSSEQQDMAAQDVSQPSGVTISSLPSRR